MSELLPPLASSLVPVVVPSNESGLVSPRTPIDTLHDVLSEAQENQRQVLRRLPSYATMDSATFREPPPQYSREPTDGSVACNEHATRSSSGSSEYIPTARDLAISRELEDQLSAAIQCFLISGYAALAPEGGMGEDVRPDQNVESDAQTMSSEHERGEGEVGGRGGGLSLGLLATEHHCTSGHHR